MADKEKILGINRCTFINSPSATNNEGILNYQTIGQLRRFLNRQDLILYFDQALDEVKTELDNFCLLRYEDDKLVLLSKLHLIKGIAASMGMNLVHTAVLNVEESVQVEQEVKVVMYLKLIREAYERTKHNKHLILQDE